MIAVAIGIAIAIEAPPCQSGHSIAILYSGGFRTFGSEKRLTIQATSHQDAEMKFSRLIVAAVTCALVWGLAGTILAADPRPPTDEDRCGVCGMFVAKYPNWVATVVFADGSQVFFDGPKDLFRYILNLEDFNAEDREISEIFVTDYYRTAFIDAESAFFVSGSDVMGPMGGELIPLEKREEAETFAKDHGGREILEFDDITPDKIPR